MRPRSGVLGWDGPGRLFRTHSCVVPLGMDFAVDDVWDVVPHTAPPMWAPTQTEGPPTRYHQGPGAVSPLLFRISRWCPVLYMSGGLGWSGSALVEVVWRTAVEKVESMAPTSGFNR